MIKYIIALFIFIVLYYLYKNLYIKKNMHCNYCNARKGNHYHFIKPKIISSELNYASSKIRCDICKKYPEENHLHNI